MIDEKINLIVEIGRKWNAKKVMIEKYVFIMHTSGGKIDEKIINLQF